MLKTASDPPIRITLRLPTANVEALRATLIALASTPGAPPWWARDLATAPAPQLVASALGYFDAWAKEHLDKVVDA